MVTQRAHSTLDGIVAKVDYEPIVENCYYDSAKLDQNMIVKNIQNMNSKGISITADEMKSEEIYNKLNKDGVWAHIEGEYPKLLNVSVEGAMRKEIRKNGINYRINYATNTAEVIGIVDNPDFISAIFGDTLEIPEEIEHDEKSFTITSIGNNAFEGLQLSKVKLPETIRTIKEGAFRGSKIEEFNTPKKLTRIGDSAFEGCIALDSIYMPKNVTTYGKDVFKGSNAVFHIYGYRKSPAEEYAEKNNLGFIAVDDPEGKGDCAIDGLIYNLDKKNKTAIVVGMKYRLILEFLDQYNHLKIFNDIEVDGVHYQVKTIGKEALKGGQFSKIFIDSGIETIESGALAECNRLKEFSTGRGIKTLESEAFRECSELKYVGIGEDVSEVSIDAFDGCNSIIGITISSDNPYLSILDGALISKDEKTLFGFLLNNEYIEIVVPKDVTRIGKKAFVKCENVKSFEIGANVINIANDTFDGIEDKIVIKGVRGSYAEEYANLNNIKFIYMDNTPFEFRKDNFNFLNNSSNIDSYTIGSYKEYLCNSNLESAEAAEKREWGGSCAGFSIVTTLFKYGYLTPGFWKVEGQEVIKFDDIFDIEKQEVKNVYDIESAKTNKRLMWLINFYQVFQGSLKGEQIAYVSCSEDANFSDFLRVIKDNYDNKDYDYLYCGFSWDKGESVAGHAVTIIGGPEELTEEFYEGKVESFREYKYRIPICDCNSYDEYYIYIQEDMKGLSIGTDEYLNIYGSTDVTMQSLKKEFIDFEVRKYNHESIFSLEELIKSGGKVNFSEGVPIIRHNIKSNVKIENSSGEYAIINSQKFKMSEGNLNCDISPEIGTTAEGDGTITHNNVIFEDGDYYSIETLNDTEPLEASMLFGDSYMTAKTQAGGKAIFENKKSVTLTNTSGKDYEISLTLNDEFMTLPWYTITATGTDAKDIKLEMVPEGVIVSGDNLKNLKIKGNNTEETVELNINTDKNKVLITANNDETKLIAFIDTNGDGTYETPLNPEEAENKDNEEGNKKDDANKENDSKDSNKNNKKEENNNQINGVKAGDEIIYALLLLVAGTIILTIVEIIKHLFN